MATDKTRLGISTPDADATIKRLRGLPKELNSEIRQAAKKIVNAEVPRLVARARSSSKQAAAVAGTIRAKSDRLPAIVAGGARKVSMSGRKQAADQIFFGAEFGGARRKTTQQFRPHRGKTGYFLYPQLRADADDIMADWDDTVNDLIDRFEG